MIISLISKIIHISTVTKQEFAKLLFGLAFIEKMRPGPKAFTITQEQSLS
jgi:hypothetical protein